MMKKEKAPVDSQGSGKENRTVDTTKNTTVDSGMSREIESGINSDSLTVENYPEIVQAIRKVEGEAIRKKLCRDLAGKLKLNEYDVISEAENGKQERKRKLTMADAIDADALMAEKLPEQQYIVDPLLPAGSLLLLQGRRGHLKSIIALELAIAISQGRPFLGWRAIQTPVLYFDLENPKLLIQKRLKLLKAGKGLKLFLRKDILNINIEKQIDELAEIVKGRVCVFDTLSKTHLREENNNPEMTIVMMKFIELAQDHSAGCVILHHHGKNPELGGRGAISIEDNADIVIDLSRGTDTLTFRCTKHRDADESKLGKILKVNFEHDTIEIKDVSDQELNRFYEALKDLSDEERQSQRNIFNSLKGQYSQERIRDYIKALKQAGLISQTVGENNAFSYSFSGDKYPMGAHGDIYIAEKPKNRANGCFTGIGG